MQVFYSHRILNNSRYAINILTNELQLLALLDRSCQFSVRVEVSFKSSATSRCSFRFVNNSIFFLDILLTISSIFFFNDFLTILLSGFQISFVEMKTRQIIFYIENLLYLNCLS